MSQKPNQEYLVCCRFLWAMAMPGTEQDTTDSCRVKELTSREQLLEGILNPSLLETGSI